MTAHHCSSFNTATQLIVVNSTYPPPLDTIRGMYILIGHASTPSKDSRPLFKPAATLSKRGGRTSWSL